MLRDDQHKDRLFLEAVAACKKDNFRSAAGPLRCRRRPNDSLLPSLLPFRPPPRLGTPPDGPPSSWSRCLFLSIIYFLRYFFVHLIRHKFKSSTLKDQTYLRFLKNFLLALKTLLQLFVYFCSFFASYYFLFAYFFYLSYFVIFSSYLYDCTFIAIHCNLTL